MSSNDDNNKNTQSSPVDQMVRNLAADSYTTDGQYNQLGFAQPQPQNELYSLPRVVHNGYNSYMLPDQPLPQEQPMYGSPNGHYVQQNYVLPQQNLFLNDNRYEKHTNTDYMYQNLNMNYQPYLNFSTDNNFVYDATPQQFNPPQAANSNQFLESLSGNWNTGTYSPFGNSNLFDSESHKHNETLSNIELPSFNQFGSVRETSNTISASIAQQQPKKPRAIAEVKPMRPSYSDVLLKSAPNTVGNSTNKIGNSINKTSEIKEIKVKAKEKDSNNKKSNKTSDKLNKNSLNRSNTTNEIKDLPADKSNVRKANVKPAVHHQLNRKWASLDNVTNDQAHSFNKPEPIEHKPKSATKSSNAKSVKKNPKLPSFADSANKQSSNTCSSHADFESSPQTNFNTNNTKANDNGNNRQVGARKGNSGSGIRVVRQRNYEQPERERQGTGKRGGQRTGKVKKDCNMPLGEEAMKRLLACKGKDPYSILGVTADCSDEDIRRYYRRQAFLVHPDKNQQPGAEEAFKILVHAFDMIGVAERREAYDRGVAESVQVEQAWSELTTLLAQLQAKVAAAANTIRCSTCSSRHKRTRLSPPRPVYAARWCAQCRIRHGAREGDIWAESAAARVAQRDNGNGTNRHGAVSTDGGAVDGGGGVGSDGGATANVLGKWWVYVSGGWRWHYYACMEGAVYDVTEWAACQRESLKHLKADQHCVQYRIALGKQQQQQSSNTSYNHSNSGTSGHNPTSANTSKRHRNSSGNYANQSGAAPDLEHLLNSLYGRTDASAKAGTTSSNGSGTGQDGGSSNCATGQRRRSRKNK